MRARRYHKIQMLFSESKKKMMRGRRNLHSANCCDLKVKSQCKKTLSPPLMRICQRVHLIPKTSTRLQGLQNLDGIIRTIMVRLRWAYQQASTGKSQPSRYRLRATLAIGTEPLKPMTLTRPRYWRARQCRCLPVIRCALVISPMVLVLLKREVTVRSQASSPTLCSTSNNFDLFLNKRLVLMVL